MLAHSHDLLAAHNTADKRQLWIVSPNIERSHTRRQTPSMDWTDHLAEGVNHSSRSSVVAIRFLSSLAHLSTYYSNNMHPVDLEGIPFWFLSFGSMPSK